MENIVSTIVEEINQTRREYGKHKGQDVWWYYQNNQYGIRLKAFKTWIQRIEANGFKDGSPMAMNVKEFKLWLTDWLQTCLSYNHV